MFRTAAARAINEWTSPTALVDIGIRPEADAGIAYVARGERWRLPDADAKSTIDHFAQLTVFLVALLSLSACVRYPRLRIPSLF